MKAYTSNNIRNIAVLGHGGKGKTTLCEAMLYIAGASDRLGRVADGNTVLDFDSEEKRRKSSVSSAIAALEWDNTKLNIIDAPGLFDFEGGAAEAVRAAEAVLIVTSAGSGVDVGTEKAFRAAEKKGAAKFFAVTKTDSDHRNFYKTFDALKEVYGNGRTHFQEMSTGQINATELAASLICSEKTIPEGIRHLQDVVDGSMTLLLLTKDGIYAARDKKGRTPLVIGKKEGAYCASFENFAYLNLGYTDYHELGPGEIDFITPESVEMLVPPQEEMKICSFLWVYYGYPTASYEGINVEEMRYHCGAMLAKRDAGSNVHPDLIAGVPDSGIAHAIGYANESKVPFARPFIKYTPTWPRSFMPTNQEQRNLIARMKLIPVQALIDQKKLLLIDDSIVRGTQLRETTEFLYQSGAKEVHVRPACPPLLYGCKFLNFSRSKSELDLITRRIILEKEGENAEKVLEEYADPTSDRYESMCQEICRRQNFTSLRYHRLDDLVESIGLPKCKMCTYCFDGKE